MEKLNADVALLAPVPEVHLLSGLETCKATGLVAFGSDAGMVLSDFAFQVGADSIADVLIYASESLTGGPPTATYRARWVKYEGSKGGFAPPSIAKHRPSTTTSDGAFLSFWVVSDLCRLDAHEAIETKKLRGRGNRTPFVANYVPKGPVIIDNPF